MNLDGAKQFVIALRGAYIIDDRSGLPEYPLIRVQNVTDPVAGLRMVVPPFAPIFDFSGVTKSIVVIKVGPLMVVDVKYLAPLATTILAGAPAKFLFFRKRKDVTDKTNGTPISSVLSVLRGTLLQDDEPGYYLMPNQ